MYRKFENRASTKPSSFTLVAIDTQINVACNKEQIVSDGIHLIAFRQDKDTFPLFSYPDFLPPFYTIDVLFAFFRT